MTIQDQVFDAMLHGPISIKQIMTIQNLSEKQVRCAMDRLRVNRGHAIESNGKFVFTLRHASVPAALSGSIYRNSGLGRPIH
jgi:hypothetical protein